MKNIYTLLTFSFFWTSIFGQVNILELLPEKKIFAANVKHITELYQTDYGDSIERKPVLRNEFWFNEKGRLIIEIEYEKFINKGDTVRVVNSYYDDSLLTREIIYNYPRYNYDSIQTHEIIYKYEYDGNRLINYKRDNSYEENYHYNEQGLIDTLIIKWHFHKTSIYIYRDNGSLEKVDTYTENDSYSSKKESEIESTTWYDEHDREIKYQRYTPGDSHTIWYRRYKYNANGTLKMSVRQTVEQWKYKKHYSYNQQGQLTSIKTKNIYPRSVTIEVDLAMESDPNVSAKEIRREQKLNKEIEKRGVIKGNYTYRYNSNNLPIQIQEKDETLLGQNVRTFLYEYY